MMSDPWITITTTTSGSLRVWREHYGLLLHVKGSVTLQRYSPSGQYFIAYNGHKAGEGTAATGMFQLPRPSLWMKISANKVKSRNAKARVVLLEFDKDDTFSVSMEKMQITIPFVGDGKKEKAFIKAFTTAAADNGVD